MARTLPRFASHTAMTRQRIAEAKTLPIVDRDYKRDPDGKFARGGGGLRQSLQDAKSIDELNATAAAEAKRITGFDTDVNFAGSDLQIAREHAEGVLRGMEHAPTTHVTAVYTYGEGGSRPARDDEGGGEYANARGADDEATEIGFSTQWSADPDGYRASLAKDMENNGSIGGGPIGVGVHEFGHVASHQARHEYEKDLTGGYGTRREFAKLDVEWEAHDHAHRQAGKTERERYDKYRSHVEREISFYASWERGELTAEAFADVVLNGDKASQLSHDIYQMVTRGP